MAAGRRARRRSLGARRDRRLAAAGRARGARGARRRRSTTCRGSSPACPSTSCSGCGATGRRPRGRSGSAIPTTWRDAPRLPTQRGFKRLKLKLGGRDGLDLDARPGRSRSDRAPAPGRRQRVLDASTRRSSCSRRCALEYCEQPLPARRPRRARAEAPLRRSRSTSTRTATRSPTSRSAPSARTASTSSSPSPAGSARRCGWRTPRARSGSA